MTRDVAIIGGGLAGCVAAWRLARMGFTTDLIEAKSHLGGRATSYALKDWPVPVDNGQHVILGCCSKLREFAGSIGVAGAIQWHDVLPVVDEDSVLHVLRPGTLPSPAHLFPILRDFPGLSRTERARIVGCILALGCGAGGNGNWGAAARHLGQSERIQHLFWHPILVSVFNANPFQVGTTYVRHLVREAFLSDRESMKIGLFCMPLGELFSAHIHPALVEAGVRFHMSKRVRQIGREGNTIAVHLHDQSVIADRNVVMAVPADHARNILEESTGFESAGAGLAALAGHSSIVSVHLRYDRPLTDLPFLLLQSRISHWIFNKGSDDEHQYLQAVISGVDEGSMSKTEFVEAADADVRDALGPAHLIQSAVIMEKGATFMPAANVPRPEARTAWPDLFMAGDHTDTGWPATLESAVRSGYAAAEACAHKI